MHHEHIIHQLDHELKGSIAIEGTKQIGKMIMKPHFIVTDSEAV